MDSNEVKWHNTEIHAGIYVYLMEVGLGDAKSRGIRGLLEVYYLSFAYFIA